MGCSRGSGTRSGDGRRCKTASDFDEPAPCDQLSRNTAILRVSSLFSVSPIARRVPVAYGADHPRARRPDLRPSSRTTAARAVPAITVSAAQRSAPRIHEERGVIHKVLILFALCIAGLAAIAAGFQHIPS